MEIDTHNKPICNICLEEIDKDGQITLKCKHTFCYDCIFYAYLYSDKRRICPYCRKDGGYLPLPPGGKPSKHIHKEYKITTNIHVPLLYKVCFYLKKHLKQIAILLDIPLRREDGTLKLKNELYKEIKKICDENPVIVSTI